MNRQASLESQRQLSSRFETNRDAPRDRAIAGMRLVAAPPVVPRQPADRLIWDPKVRACASRQVQALVLVGVPTHVLVVS